MPPRSRPRATPKPPSAAPAKPAKTFSPQTLGKDTSGERLIVYGDSGMGKTSLAMLAPRPLFIAPDPGVRKLVRSSKREVGYVPDVASFADLRDALSTLDLSNYDTLVIDTLTMVETNWSIPWMLEHTPPESSKVKSVEAYGWGKGYKVMEETMALLQPALDILANRRKHIVLICQGQARKVPNFEGLDYLQHAPALTDRSTGSVYSSWIAWCDHVVRIGHQTTAVHAANADAKVGKIVDTGDERCVFSSSRRHFFAKSRTLNSIEEIVANGGAISFTDPDDDSFWQYLLGDQS